MKDCRSGEENYNAFGTLMKIIEYKNCDNIIVEFQDEYKYKKNCKYKCFKKGEVKNPYDKTINNIGFLGEGKYDSKNNSKAYKVWTSMLRRCYDPYELNKYPTYIDCYVCEEWHNFQNFCKWWEENVYNCNNERMELDKDILIKGNKIYSPKTCIIVPQRINSLFVKCNARRGTYPIGVCWDKERNLFASYCCILENNKKKNKKIGRYNNELDAFLAYKQFKEKYIKEVADEYKDLIPSELYEALYKYKIEIND